MPSSEPGKVLVVDDDGCQPPPGRRHAGLRGPGVRRRVVGLDRGQDRDPALPCPSITADGIDDVVHHRRRQSFPCRRHVRPVRPCVSEKGITNCAYCDEFICEKLKQRIVNKMDLEKSLNRELTDDEYNQFVKPYESEERLNKIRSQ